MTRNDDRERIADIVRRLLGLHALRPYKRSGDTKKPPSASEVIGLPSQTLSELQSGSRGATLHSIQKLSKFFEISQERLTEATFEQLLEKELADVKRFRRVEAKIKRYARKNTSQ
jgi:plasmid maintenance system antidote protein VapI